MKSESPVAASDFSHGCQTARKNCAAAPGGTGTEMLMLLVVSEYVVPGVQAVKSGELWTT